MEFLNKLAVDGVLPFEAYVQVRDGNTWILAARSRSVAELVTLAREEAAVLGCSRIIAGSTGSTWETFSVDPVDPETLSVGDFVRVRRMFEGNVLWEYGGVFAGVTPYGNIRVEINPSSSEAVERPSEVFLV